MCVQWSGSLCLDFSSGDCVKSHTLAINVKQLQWSSGEMSTGLVGITPAIGLSAYWLAGCHWRPGCRGNRTSVTSCSCSPPRPSPLSAAPSRSYSGPYLLPFKGQGLRKLPHACIYVRMYMCLWVRMTVWTCVCVCVCVCVTVTACLCHAGWPLSPLVMDCDANLLQQLTTSLSLLSWKNQRERELF